MRLNKTNVESKTPPAKGEQLYWDTELTGFGLRITAKGRRSYIVQGRVKGKATYSRTTIGHHGAPISDTETLTADKARKLAMGVIAELSNGVDPREKEKLAAVAAVTLRDVATDYCKKRRTPKGGALTEKSIRDIERHVKANFGDWADKPILAITSEMCRDRHEQISARSESQANQAFRILRALINYSADEENPRPNPVATLSKKKLWNADRQKTNYIPLDRVGAAWNTLQERRTSPALLPIAQTGADLISFIMLAGCRWSEAAELTWDCVNLDAGTWHIADPKNHNPVTFPLSTAARALLDARPRVDGCDYVFAGRGKTPFITDARTTMAAVSLAAGLRITAHDLRRGFITIGIDQKIEMWKMKLLTNHVAKGDVTIDHYTETSDLRYLAADVEKIAAWIVKQGVIAAAGNVVQLRGAA